jgi:hypothetical protein
MKAILKKSTNSKKKYMVILYDGDKKIKTIHFGATGYQDYTTHKDDERKKRYIKRHRARENHNNYKTAGFWALHILWNKKTIASSIKDIKKNYNINITKK